jgi:hypothetical protein
MMEAGTAGNGRLLYLHIPKTGGHWAVTAMRYAGVELHCEGGKRHARLRDVVPGDRFTFAFVREPLSWYASWWNHCRVIDRTWLDKAPEVKAPHVHFVGLPFDEYMEAMVEHAPGFLSKLYSDFVGPPGNPISFVGRYERLADDVACALREAEETFDEVALRMVPPLNTSGARAELPEELAGREREAESETYERFYGTAVPG